MKKHLLLATMMLSACATTGGGKGASAPFQGQDAVNKRRQEVTDAGKPAMDCLKPKPGVETPKGGIFAVSADATGKLTVSPILWSGADSIKQCIIDTGNKTTVTPMPGPAVGTLWEFSAPGVTEEPQKPPTDWAVKMQSFQETWQNQAINCEQRYLGVDFPATTVVSYYVYDGKAYIPTVTDSDSKDGSYEKCLMDIISETKFPSEPVSKPFPSEFRFRVGQYGDTHVNK